MSNLNATVHLNTVWGAVTGVKEAMSVVEKGTADALSAGTRQGMESGAKQASSKLESVVKKLHEAGFSQSAAKARSEFTKLAREREGQAKQLARLEHRLRTQNISKEQKAEFESRKKYLRREMKLREVHQEKLLKAAQRQAQKAEQQVARRDVGGGGAGAAPGGGVNFLEGGGSGGGRRLSHGSGRSCCSGWPGGDGRHYCRICQSCCALNGYRNFGGQSLQ